MKRLISLILCLCMLSMGAVAFAANNKMTETATDDTDFGEGASINITAVATNKSEDAEDAVYSVEIVWGDMAFAYGFSAEKTVAIWDPEEHEYTYETKTAEGSASGTEAEQGWYMVNEAEALTNAGAVEETGIGLTTQNAVMVFNHSNEPVDAKIAVTNSNEKFNATFTKMEDCKTTTNTNGAYALERGEVGKVYNKDKQAYIAGEINVNFAEGVKAEDAGLTDSATTIASLTITISKPTSAVAGDGE